MQNELTCNQVLALMSFYVEDKLNSKLKEYVDNHLKNCPQCRKIYMQSQKIANHILTLANDTPDDTPYHTEQYKKFKNSLSAYVDNELDEHESIRIKKIAISNPMARKDLEDMYTFKRMLHDSFNKTKNDWKNDYSKLIINRLNCGDSVHTTDSFRKIIFAFATMITLIVAGFLVILYF